MVISVSFLISDEVNQLKNVVFSLDAVSSLSLSVAGGEYLKMLLYCHHELVKIVQLELFLNRPARLRLLSKSQLTDQEKKLKQTFNLHILCRHLINYSQSKPVFFHGYNVLSILKQIDLFCPLRWPTSSFQTVNSVLKTDLIYQYQTSVIARPLVLQILI